MCKVIEAATYTHAVRTSNNKSTKESPQFLLLSQNGIVQAPRGISHSAQVPNAWPTKAKDATRETRLVC